MRSVKINKDKLLAAVRENRTTHIEEYAEAIAAYREAMIDELKDRLDHVEGGGEVDHYIEVMKPSSHEADYDRVIAMLEFSEDDVIELTSTEFAQYVQDEWAWKREFDAVSSNYGTGKFSAR